MKTGDRLRQFTAMVGARTMEFIRDRGTFFWNLGFPILLIFGFAFGSAVTGSSLFKVAAYGPAPQGFVVAELEQVTTLHYDGARKGEDLGTVLDRLRHHELDLVIDYGAKRYWLNSTGRSSSLLRRLIQGDPLASAFSEELVEGQPIRYIDWLLPGVIGMNMLFSSLSGVGFVLVRYRRNGVLKRLRATPVSALSFVAAQSASRFLIVAVTSLAVFAGTNAFLHFVMRGSWLLLALVMVAGILCMLALGLVFASRMRSEELAGGLLNLVTFPMLALSGVFFSLEGSPPPLRAFSSFLPLTKVVDSARAIMIDGAGFVAILPGLAYLLAFTAVCTFLAAALFRWD